MAKENAPAANAAGAADNRGVLSGAHDYFVNNVLPDDIKACVKRIKSPTLYMNNHDQTFILVRSGKGILTVNGLEYDLDAGTLVNLGPFHRYRYIPAAGSASQGYICRHCQRINERPSCRNGEKISGSHSSVFLLHGRSFRSDNGKAAQELFSKVNPSPSIL